MTLVTKSFSYLVTKCQGNILTHVFYSQVKFLLEKFA
jgi:hypothetical protein